MEGQRGNSFERIVSCLVLVVLMLFCSRISAQASERQSRVQPNDACLSVKSGSVLWPGSSIGNKLSQAIRNDSVKVQALSQALSVACRVDLINQSESPAYRRLKELLRMGQEESESTGIPPSETVRRFGLEAGVTKEDVTDSRGKVIGWQLVIDKKSKEDMGIRTAASLASHGYLFIEAFHQISKLPDLQSERQVLLDAIEKTAKAILDKSDENGDGRVGWGRVWFKGKDGLLLHTTLPAQNIYFGGYTYFPRADSSGRMTCEKSLSLKEEAFDHAHNTIFLLETFLVTRDRSLAKRILQTVGKSFDDTFDEGGTHKQLGDQGWYYWKSIGKQRQAGYEECEVGREIKNTNLRMGVALLIFSEVLRRNREELGKDSGLSFAWEKYRHRADQVIRTNNYEIFGSNNYGYQGANSRDVEMAQEPDKKLFVYDRTQTMVPFITEEVGDLRDVISAGNQLQKKELPDAVTVCSGSASAPVIDRSVAGSCWNHLAFEAEDYFRIARITGAWEGRDQVALRDYVDAMTRNLAAAKILHDGRGTRYAHYFPSTAEKSVSNEVINSAFYGFFCLAKNIMNHQGALGGLPVAHQNVLKSMQEICDGIPLETAETGVTWRKGYKFHELYLAADRFDIPGEDWLLSNKK
jgi:hypothetical protein